MGEEISMPRVEGLLGGKRDRDISFKNPLDEGAAICSMKLLPDTPKAVDEATDPCVGHANHRQAGLHRAELGVGEMLPRPHGMLKPSVVGERYEQLRSEFG